MKYFPIKTFSNFTTTTFSGHAWQDPHVCTRFYGLEFLFFGELRSYQRALLCLNLQKSLALSFSGLAVRSVEKTLI